MFSDSAADLVFSCKLDGRDYSPCASPEPYTGLSDGAHTFRVRATDAAGNTGAASVYGWTVDTIAPDTAISSGPAAASTSAAAAFAFTSSEQSSFSCSVDGRAFAPCVSPQTFGGLANGNHAFRVRATDAAGNTDPSPASYAWTVNAVVPTRIDKTPPANVSKVAKSVRYRMLKLSWKRPADPDFDHVVVVMGKNPKRAPTTPVYRGARTSYTDSKFRNGFYHRYAITSYDRAGNASRRVAVVVPTGVLLASPRAGARLRKPPLLDWASVPKATYYNVQLYLGSKKVLTAWPSALENQAQTGMGVSGQRHPAEEGHIPLVCLARLRPPVAGPLRPAHRAGDVRRGRLVGRRRRVTLLASVTLLAFAGTFAFAGGSYAGAPRPDPAPKPKPDPAPRKTKRPVQPPPAPPPPPPVQTPTPPPTAPAPPPPPPAAVTPSPPPPPPPPAVTPSPPPAAATPPRARTPRRQAVRRKARSRPKTSEEVVSEKKVRRGRQDSPGASSLLSSANARSRQAPSHPWRQPVRARRPSSSRSASGPRSGSRC